MLIDFRELFPKYGLKFNGVLHVGSNVGEERDVYREIGIEKQVWIEANPEIFLILKENISNNPQAIAFNICAGDENKDVVLHISNNHSQSSSVLELGTHKIEHPNVYYVADVTVPMYKLEEFFAGIGVEGKFDDLDLLNIDVQGFELNVLKGMGDMVKQFKAIYLECNKDYVYEKCALVGDIDFYLGAYGFERVETKWAPNKNWGDCLFIKS